MSLASPKAALDRRRGRHRADPDGVGGTVRLVVTMWSAVVIQAYLVEPAGSALVRSLDVPLAITTVLVLARPGRSAGLALVCGLLVDAFGRRLFGIHVLAYAVIGPVLQLVPIGPHHRSAPSVGVAAGLAAAMASGIVVSGLAVVDGGIPAGSVARIVGAAVWTALLAGVLSGPASRRLAPLTP